MVEIQLQNGTTITTNSNGNQVSVVQNLFKGKIYFTIDHNLWVTDGKNNTREIMTGGNISDPAVSPNGKWIVVSMRFNNSSDIDYYPCQVGVHDTPCFQAVEVFIMIVDLSKAAVTGLHSLHGRQTAHISSS